VGLFIHGKLFRFSVSPISDDSFSINFVSDEIIYKSTITTFLLQYISESKISLVRFYKMLNSLMSGNSSFSASFLFSSVDYQKDLVFDEVHEINGGIDSLVMKIGYSDDFGDTTYYFVMLEEEIIPPEVVTQKRNSDSAEVANKEIEILRSEIREMRSELEFLRSYIPYVKSHSYMIREILLKPELEVV